MIADPTKSLHYLERAIKVTAYRNQAAIQAAEEAVAMGQDLIEVAIHDASASQRQEWIAIAKPLAACASPHIAERAQQIVEWCGESKRVAESGSGRLAGQTGRTTGIPWNVLQWPLPLLGPMVALICAGAGAAIGNTVQGLFGTAVFEYSVIGAALGIVGFVVAAIALRKKGNFDWEDRLSAIVGNSWCGLFVGGLTLGVLAAILSQTIGRPTGPLLAVAIGAIVGGLIAGATLQSDLD